MPTPVRGAVATSLALPVLGTLFALRRSARNRRVSPIALTSFGVLYAATSLGLEAGYHRLLSHRAYRTRAPVRFGLLAAGAMAGEGPPSWWASVHRRHHFHTDREGDPHSPIANDAGFLHAHILWLLGPSPEEVRHRDLAEDPVVRAVDRQYLAWVATGLLIQAAAGAAVGGRRGAIDGLLWGGFVRMAVCHQMSWTLNSVAHLWGARPQATRDGSRNVWWLALPTMGAAWHNNHHHRPMLATNDERWWQVDPTGWLIRLLGAVGLADRIRHRFRRERIAPHANQTIYDRPPS